MRTTVAFIILPFYASTDACLLAPDYQHRVFTFSNDGKLYLAPIDENVSNVLDVATGTGIWAIEFGTLPAKPAYMGDIEN